jgi:uncharacterized protein YndB with AHSA1/START domain
MKGTPRETWRALTDDVNTWWLADFHMLSPDSVVSFEARAGGALLEQGTDGRSLLWYTVQMAVPNESLHLVGHIGPDWGGPATSMLSLTLETRGVETVLSVRDALFGHTTDELVDSLCNGWRQLFTDDLKAHLEG